MQLAAGEWARKNFWCTPPPEIWARQGVKRVMWCTTHSYERRSTMKFLNRRTGTAPRTGTRRRLLTTGALLCIGIMPLSACSLFNPPLERDESVHAIFDAEQDIVKMPLDDYPPPTTRALITNTRPFRLPLSSATPNTGRATPNQLPNLKARRVAIRAESTVPGTSNTPRSTDSRSETPTPKLPSPLTRGRA